MNDARVRCLRLSQASSSDVEGLTRSESVRAAETARHVKSERPYSKAVRNTTIECGESFDFISIVY